MNRTTRLYWMCAAICGAGFAALLAIGCGGGGSSSSSGGSSQVGVFVTDSFRDDYSHVWATIFKVELINTLGQATAVFDDSTGRVIDLKTLRDSTGQRFSFLALASVPAGTYTSVRVTLAPNLSLIPVGATTGPSLPLDSTLPRDSNGNVLVTFNLPAPRNINGNDDVTVDFDLANFALHLGQIIPSLKDGGKNGLGDLRRHEREDYEGIVSALSGVVGSQSFTLTRGHQAVTVSTSAGTVIFNAGGAPNPVLVNGARVHVVGMFSTATNSLSATSIKIQGASDQDQQEVSGAPVAVNSSAGAFDVTVARAEGFVPLHTTVHIVTTTTTVYRGESGVSLVQSDFFARLSTSSGVEADGVYDPSTNTLTAVRVKIDDETGADPHEAEAKGAPTSISGATFVLNPVTEFDGFAFNGTALNVTTTGSTAFKSKTGATLTSSAFFTALATASSVKVQGTFASSTLTATKVQFQ